MIDKDHYLYQLNGSFAILSLSFDNILLAWNNMDIIITAKKWLSSNFDMKDMGEASYVPKVKILRDWSKRILDLSQRTYVKSILERFWMQSCKSIDSPIAKGESLSIEMGPKTTKEKEQMAHVPNSSAVDILMHAMMYTWPDIYYAVRLVRHYMSNPRLTSQQLRGYRITCEVQPTIFFASRARTCT